MVGWNNLLPIGKAHGTVLGTQGSGLREWREKVYPVAGTVRGHSSEAMGPWTP